MGDIFLAECPTVATIGASEVRFSVMSSKTRSIRGWPLSWVSCDEATPPQTRLQWGVPTGAARLDSFNGIRIGDERNNLTLGSRSTTVGSESAIAPVENQRVGVATLNLGGRYRFKYWNDHAFWWWPIGDGGDQGDTAGLQFSYNVGTHGLSAGRGWMFSDLSLTMRLASGIPDRKSAVPMGDGEVYSSVAFSAVDRGDLTLSTSLSKRSHRLDVGVTVNSGTLRNVVQSKGVHKTLGIPEFPKTHHVEVMLFMRLTEF